MQKQQCLPEGEKQTGVSEQQGFGRGGRGDRRQPRASVGGGSAAGSQGTSVRPGGHGGQDWLGARPQARGARRGTAVSTLRAEDARAKHHLCGLAIHPRGWKPRRRRSRCPGFASKRRVSCRNRRDRQRGDALLLAQSGAIRPGSLPLGLPWATLSQVAPSAALGTKWQGCLLMLQQPVADASKSCRGEQEGSCPPGPSFSSLFYCQNNLCPSFNNMQNTPS